MIDKYKSRWNLNWLTSLNILKLVYVWLAVSTIILENTTYLVLYRSKQSLGLHLPSLFCVFLTHLRRGRRLVSSRKRTCARPRFLLFPFLPSVADVDNQWSFVARTYINMGGRDARDDSSRSSMTARRGQTTLLFCLGCQREYIRYTQQLLNK